MKALLLGMLLLSPLLQAAAKPAGLGDYLAALNACSLAAAECNQATLGGEGRVKLKPGFDAGLNKFKAALKKFEALRPSSPEFAAHHRRLLLELGGQAGALEGLKKAVAAKDTENASRMSARAMIHAREYLMAYREFMQQFGAK